MQPVRGSWLDAVLESGAVESPEALSVLHGKHVHVHVHVASRMQCELIRIHIAWAFVESNNHCDLNQKALMVAFQLSRNKCLKL